jgi:hypothetical protein
VLELRCTCPFLPFVGRPSSVQARKGAMPVSGYAFVSCALTLRSHSDATVVSEGSYADG